MNIGIYGKGFTRSDVIVSASWSQSICAGLLDRIGAYV